MITTPVIVKVISGGQTGADLAGLRAAKALGIETGGYAPHGWYNETGAQEDLLRGFGLTEHASPAYRDRTAANIIISDVTLLVSKLPLEGGSKLTKDLLQRQNLPHRVINERELLIKERWLESVGEAALFLKQTFVTRGRGLVVNVAGSRESKFPGIGELAEKHLREVFSICMEM
jgi:hypothetical protein